MELVPPSARCVGEYARCVQGSAKRASENRGLEPDWTVVQDGTSLTVCDESPTGLWNGCLSTCCTRERVWSRQNQQGQSEAKSPPGAIWHAFLACAVLQRLMPPAGNVNVVASCAP